MFLIIVIAIFISYSICYFLKRNTITNKNFLKNIKDNKVNFDQNDLIKRQNIYNKNINTYNTVNPSNPFLSWTQEEFKAMFYNYTTCSNPDINFIDKNELIKVSIDQKYNYSFDWATSNNYLGVPIVSEIFFQGFCGSCYAFATLCVVESVTYLYNNDFTVPLKTISVQQLIDCTTSETTVCNPEYPCNGCGGCNIRNIIPSYFNTFRVITTNDYNPYTYYGTTNIDPAPTNLKTFNYELAVQNCKNIENEIDSSSLINNSVYINSLQMIYIRDEKYLKQALYKYGPIYVSYSGATNNSFKFYPSNIPGSEPTTINDIYIGPKYSINPNITGTHAMVVTGWGKEQLSKFNTINYWIIKNSWGLNWGLDGYLKLKMSKNNTLFDKITGLRLYRPCAPFKNSTYLEITSAPIWWYKNSKYYVNIGITFKAFRINPGCNFILEILVKIPSGNDSKNGIYPINQQNKPYNFEPLLDNDGNKIQFNSKYYFNSSPFSSNFIQSNINNGLWFSGNINIIGITTGSIVLPVSPSLIFNGYEWDFFLKVYDNRNFLDSRTTKTINWSNAVYKNL